MQVEDFLQDKFLKTNIYKFFILCYFMVKELKGSISKIFQQEITNIGDGITYNFKLKETEPEKLSDGSTMIRTSRPHMRFRTVEDMNPEEDILDWDTYNTLKKLYGICSLDEKKEFLEFLVQILLNSKESLFAKYYVQGSSSIYKTQEEKKMYKTHGFLAFYFLIKNNNSKVAVNTLVEKIDFIHKRKSKKQMHEFKGSDDILYFLNETSDLFLYINKYFDEDSLNILKELANAYYGHKLRDKISKYLYENLKNSLDGVELELDYYKEEVLNKITKFDFDKKLSIFINEIYEEIYLDIDKKSYYSGLIGNLRQFFTDLRIAIARKIEKITGDKLQNQDPATIQDYLRKHLKLNDGDMWFMKSIVKIQHVEGGHDYFSEKKYAILVKNIVLELSYFLLESLDEFEKQNKS